jgi:hypothetical protein
MDLNPCRLSFGTGVEAFVKLMDGLSAWHNLYRMAYESSFSKQSDAKAYNAKKRAALFSKNFEEPL